MALGTLIGLASTPFARTAPAAIQVDLFASLPRARPAARPVAKRPAPAAPKSAPKPPAPRVSKIVIPENPSPSPRKPRPKPPREYAYDDALDRLREELGESLEEPEVADAESDALAADSSGGLAVDRDTAAWILATRRHVRAVWVTPAEFLDRPLATEVSVNVRADGSVVGMPEMVVSSGDPFWDDNAVRAILAASPLPAPPRAGVWRLRFTPRENR